MAETERNLCAELGCMAACCRDMWFTGITKQKLPWYKSIFPQLTQVPYDDIQDIKTPGVYFCDMANNYVLLHITGKCPNNINGNCSVYTIRPVACRLFDFASDDCMEAQGLITSRT